MVRYAIANTPYSKPVVQEIILRRQAASSK